MKHHLPKAATAEQRRANHRARCRRYAERNAKLGLTAKGSPRKTFFSEAERKQRAAARDRARRHNLFSLGLNNKGETRKYRPTALAYRAFRNSLILPAPRDWSDLVSFERRSEAA